MTYQIKPNAIYNNGGTVEGVCPIQTKQQQIALGAAQQVVAAVSGKRIRVVGGTAFSTGIQTDINFISDTGGGAVNKKLIGLPALATALDPNIPLVRQPGDEFETETGKALYATTNNVAANTNVNYIIYTPAN